jgi:hypothetical protein
VCPHAWREAKVIPLPKNSKAPFTASKKKELFDQIQSYFTVNKLTTDFQLAALMSG